MKSNKGFTLIELLAVIVILAIIALIATPIVLGIIDDARNGAQESTAQMIIDNVELAYSTAYIKNNGVTPTVGQVAEAFKMDGVKMNANGTFEVTSGHADCKHEVKNNVLIATCNPKYNPQKEYKTSTESGMIVTATDAGTQEPEAEPTEPGTENTDPAQGA